ncbi:SHOCT domain-containing protein [Streptomyces radicis]|uniref:SHOCT domain-containing protein n=1 Tax=Streptomyces radicis TaxID=1750517 RepID=A0A3A9WI12_9ACTN|nr:SHOCT domain-containing protein [Streptomyces radicis]RKN12605.1 SHOCT domain-containing protein [Streptomyces radicis]RKN27632.1 SHOCT domain-containing protein [Streptomyces radicis]
METLAHTVAHTFDDGGPGPWILLFPLIWAAVVAGAFVVLRRTVWRGGRRPWRETPADLLARRFAAGEIEADEYRGRLAVLGEDRRKGATG